MMKKTLFAIGTLVLLAIFFLAVLVGVMPCKNNPQYCSPLLPIASVFALATVVVLIFRTFNKKFQTKKSTQYRDKNVTNFESVVGFGQGMLIMFLSFFPPFYIRRFIPIDGLTSASLGMFLFGIQVTLWPRITGLDFHFDFRRWGGSPYTTKVAKQGNLKIWKTLLFSALFGLTFYIIGRNLENNPNLPDLRATYDSTSFPVTFRYPRGWDLEPNENIVTVKSDWNESREYQAIIIQFEGKVPSQLQKTRVRDYLSAFKQQYLADEQTKCNQRKLKGERCLASVPGFTKNFVQDTNTPSFIQNGVSVAEITPFISIPNSNQYLLISKEYIAIYNQNEYRIGLIFPKGKDSTLMEILKTVQFKL